MKNKTHKLELILYIIGGLLLLAAVLYWGYLKYEALHNTGEINRLKANIKSTKSANQNGDYESPYKAIFDMNADMVAWILIPGTKIDYPLMQTKEEEEYYIHRDFLKKNNRNGSLFVAAGSDVDAPSANILVYGHNMKSGEMFGTLDKYSDEAYEKEHSQITLFTKKETRTYTVLAAFYGKVLEKEKEGFRYYQYQNPSKQDDFKKYVENVKKMSLYDTGVTAKAGDELITLSTCAYQTKNGRFVVVAKRMD